MLFIGRSSHLRHPRTIFSNEDSFAMVAKNLAHEHMQLMAKRIDKQAAEIEQLRVTGQDTKAATQKLSLMKRAMDELRLQLGPLSPTVSDTKRPSRPIENPAKPTKKK